MARTKKIPSELSELYSFSFRRLYRRDQGSGTDYPSPIPTSILHTETVQPMLHEKVMRWDAG